jgi:hypothetical protein
MNMSVGVLAGAVSRCNSGPGTKMIWLRLWITKLCSSGPGLHDAAPALAYQNHAVPALDNHNEAAPTV